MRLKYVINLTFVFALALVATMAMAQDITSTSDLDLSEATTKVVDGRTVYHWWRSPEETRFTSGRTIEADLWVASDSIDPVYSQLSWWIRTPGGVADGLQANSRVYIGEYPEEDLFIWSYPAEYRVPCHNDQDNPFRHYFEQGQAFSAFLTSMNGQSVVADLRVVLTMFRCSHGQYEMDNPPNDEEPDKSNPEEIRNWGTLKGQYR